MNKQEYLLTCLSEEAAELIQVIGKAQRFGLDDDFFDELPRNAIKREFNDIMGVMGLLCDEEIFDKETFLDEMLVEAKKKKVKKFMEYSEKKGLLK